MKDRIDHLPHVKQHELQRVLEILFEEFDDALKEGSAEFKKRGRILKIILFGSYARGTQVDEPHTGKGYRSDFDLLIIVNNRKLADFETYWHKAEDRLMRLRDVQTPVNFIVHSLREVNTRIKEGRYFFTDIRREGIVLYELEPEPPSGLGRGEGDRVVGAPLDGHIPLDTLHHVERHADDVGIEFEPQRLGHRHARVAVDGLVQAILLPDVVRRKQAVTWLDTDREAA